MTQDVWVHRRGELARDGWQTIVDAAIPGWQHTGIRIADVEPGEEVSLSAGDVERIVIPLAGSFTVDHRGPGSDARGEVAVLAGRGSVFDGPTDVLYLSILSTATIRGTGRVAVAEAPTTEAHPSRYISREEVPVELRGAGRSSRQVHNFGTPANLAASRLIVCEVITPAENWSSYPAHKHDESRPGHESRLEEIYYFETEPSRALADAPPPEAEPFGIFVTTPSPAGDISINALVQTGDIALVPFGYHGPAVAAPGYDLYYLNVMAGPDPERAWLISDDPAQGWVRSSWDGQQIDPRLPFTPEGTHA
jgi:5-deoxy-glucuronate isomerase